MIDCANPGLRKEHPFDCPDFCEIDGHPARMDDCMLRERRMEQYIITWEGFKLLDAYFLEHSDPIVQTMWINLKNKEFSLYNPQAEREKVLALITENNRVLKIALERVESLTERATKPVYNHGQFAALINSVIERNDKELRQKNKRNSK